MVVDATTMTMQTWLGRGGRRWPSTFCTGEKSPMGGTKWEEAEVRVPPRIVRRLGEVTKEIGWDSGRCAFGHRGGVG